MKELIMLKMIDAIDLEASKLCQYNSDSPSLFCKIKVERLPEFSWDSCISELQSKAPILLRILSTLASRNDHRKPAQERSSTLPWNLHGNCNYSKRKEQGDCAEFSDWYL